MKKLTLTLWTVLLFSLFTTAQAESEYLLSEKTYKALSKAQEMMEVEQYSQAGIKLRELVKQTSAGSYDRAVVQQTLGFLYSAQEQYDKAAKAFEAALADNALPEKVSHNLRFNLAQLLIADEQYKKGIPLMESWLKREDKVQNQIYVLLASAYFRIENYKKSIEHIRTAIKNDKSPKEDWYRLQLSAHMSLKQYKSAIKVLETLITYYPYQKVYWDQLSALYLQQSKEVTALAVKMLASRLDLADARTLINLSNMYRYLQIPYKAGQLLQQGMDKGVIAADFDNLKKLSDCWLAAREPELAAQVMQSLLAKDATGETHVKLGQVYVSMEQWQPAQKVLQQAIAKVKGDKLGLAYTLLGTSYFHLKQLNKAKAQFSKAIGFKNQRQRAAQWLHYIDDLLKEQEDEATT